MVAGTPVSHLVTPEAASVWLAGCEVRKRRREWASLVRPPRKTGPLSLSLSLSEDMASLARQVPLVPHRISPPKGATSRPFSRRRRRRSGSIIDMKNCAMEKPQTTTAERSDQ